MIRRLLRAPVLLALPLALVASACAEKLETSAACPLLCPGQELNIRDTIIDPAIAFDTTLAGFPLLGAEPNLLFASRGDTLDVRPVIRFDTLVRSFAPGVDTSRAVTFVDSATLSVRLRKTGLKVPQSFFIDAYDVGDTTLVDSLPLTLLPLFTAPRLIGSVQMDSATFVDSVAVRIPLDTAKLLAIITTPGAVLRVGLRLRSTESGAFWVASSDDPATGPRLRYRVSADTTVGAIELLPFSQTPRRPLAVSGDFNDYVIVADAPVIGAPSRFVVGGLPGVRTYLRFDLPRWLTDSAAVLRARLEFVQDPVRGLDVAVPFTIRAQLVIAGNATTDLNRAARLLAPPGFFITDSLRVSPADTGAVQIEINGLVRQFRTVGGVRPIPTAIVLRADLEGTSALGARFFGLGAAPALRPRLRVSYVPSIRFGQP